MCSGMFFTSILYSHSYLGYFQPTSHEINNVYDEFMNSLPVCPLQIYSMTVLMRQRLPHVPSFLSKAVKPDKPVLVNDVGTSSSHLVFPAW